MERFEGYSVAEDRAYQAALDVLRAHGWTQAQCAKLDTLEKAQRAAAHISGGARALCA